jgi:hypothetical protein
MFISAMVKIFSSGEKYGIFHSTRRHVLYNTKINQCYRFFNETLLQFVIHVANAYSIIISRKRSADYRRKKETKRHMAVSTHT